MTVPATRTRIVSGVCPTASARGGTRPVTAAAMRTPRRTIAATRSTSRQPACGLASDTVGLGRDPDRGDEDAAGERRAPPRQQPGLGPVEGDREVGPYDRVGRVARR